MKNKLIYFLKLNCIEEASNVEIPRPVQTPACSAVPLGRTRRDFVSSLQSVTNQTAVIAPYPTASGSDKHVKCKEPYCVHSPTSD